MHPPLARFSLLCRGRVALGAGLLLALWLLTPGPTAAAGESASIKAEKYQLKNGLTVILHERHDLPMVVVNTWYHVGTREEPQGRSGFAHLFEHLMFMGTERVPGSSFDQIMEAGGGSNNASTAFDRTNYYNWGPATLLPTLLWLEADRMESVGKAMTQEKLDLQRMVVRNERREGYDNAPYGPSELLVYERMYPVDHPYHFHVIGSHEDLMAATVQDVQDFFRTYYVPSNATLVVAGDFDSATVRPMIQGLFGSLARGNEVPRRSTPVAELLREERITTADAVQVPRLTLVWHSPPFYAPGDAEMDLVASALAEDKNGRLVRRLIRGEPLAVDVSAYQVSMRLGSLFTVQVTAREGADLERIEKVIGEELAILLRDGPTQDELDRARAQIETRNLSSLQSLQEVADRLNHYDAYLGHPDGLAEDLARYASATSASVRDAARRVLDPVRRLVMRVVPATPVDAALPTRDVRPAEGAQREISLPQAVSFRLPNGLTVWHVDRPGLPLVSAQLVLPGGSVAVGPEHAGLAALTATLLGEGAGELDALQFAAALQQLGASLGASADREATFVALEVLRKHVDRAFSLMADAVLRPRFPEDSFLREQAVLGEQLQQMGDDAATLARQVGPAFLHGVSSPLGTPVSGTPARVAALCLQDVRAFHARQSLLSQATLLIAGDLRLAEAKELVGRTLGASAPAGVAALPRAATPLLLAPGDVRGRLRTLIVSRPGAAQTVIRFLAPSLPLGAAERNALTVLNTILGGSFTSRLNANLREDKGYTYGAGSTFDLRVSHGVFIASSNVQTEVTGEALKEFFHELDRIRTGDIQPEELRKSLASNRHSTLEGYETLGGITSSLSPYALAGLPPTTAAADLAALGEVTVQMLNELAKREVLREGGVLLLVGDPATAEKALAPFLGRVSVPQVITPEQALELTLR